MEREQYSSVAERTLESERQPEDVSERCEVSFGTALAGADNLQEDRVRDKTPKDPERKKEIPEKISLCYPVLLAAILTTAIAVVSAGVVFSLSGREMISRFFLVSPQTIESFFWSTQKAEVKALPIGSESRSLSEGVARQHEKEETGALSGELAAKSQEEETAPSADVLTGKLGHEGTGEGRDPAYDDGTMKTIPTVVVTVQKGDTVHRILENRFGKSGKILIGAVRELNPEIEDLDWIHIGQKIRLPFNFEVADHIQTTCGTSGLLMQKMMATSDQQSAQEVQIEQTTQGTQRTQNPKGEILF